MIRRILLGLGLLALSWPCGARAASWEERMWRQAHQKVSLDLTDVKLTEACNLVAAITGLNIILAPTLRQKDPTFTLRVQDMEAVTALKWFTELTDTYADVLDQAIFITDKPPERTDTERDELLQEGARHGVLVDLPPAGVPLLAQDIAKVAMQIVETEQMKIQDFPGPDVTLGTAANARP